jgi:electron transfer flavoprotein beta subunit
LNLEPDTVGAAAARVQRLNYFVPAAGRGAEMLQGSREEVVEKLVEMLKAKGGLN